MNLPASETITFEEAIAFTQSLLAKIETMTEVEKEQAIASLVKTENGARGFFVTYLTDERSFADCHSSGIVKGLKSAPEIVSELLVKNVAMSTAMAMTHRRNNHQEMAHKSARVTNRSIDLIAKLQLDIIAQKFKKLQETIAQGKGEYQQFIQRCGYDEEQKQKIQKVVEQINSEVDQVL
jgi:hypothetical protein